MSLLWK